MRALVTNDDGVESEGLHRLAATAVGRGLDVTVVAPAFDASGSSAALTAVASGGQVAVAPAGQVAVERAGQVAAERAGDEGCAILAVHGPPAFIVRAAMFGAFGPPPDIVLSGINRGLNTGRAVIHSGTVGAALTAATYGRRGLALSAEMGGGGENWVPEAPIVAEALDWLARAPDATVLNVNVPTAGRHQARRVRGVRGVRVTSLARAGTVQGQVSDTGGESVAVVFDDDDGPPEAGTDSAALAEGYVSVTAIRAVIEDERVDLQALIGGGSTGT